MTDCVAVGLDVGLKEVGSGVLILFVGRTRKVGIFVEEDGIILFLRIGDIDGVLVSRSRVLLFVSDESSSKCLKVGICVGSCEIEG